MRHLALTCKAGLRSLVKSEESSVGGQSAASATLPPGVRRPDSYTFRVVSETDTVAHLMVRNRVGRVPDLMRFALCRTNRLKREASATMYVVGALAFAFVEEWNGYPLGSFLFALFVAARECVLSSSHCMRVEVDSQSFGRYVGVPWRLCCVILSYHSSSRLRLLAR